MKIISIGQPRASLIVSGQKDVQNRTWPTRYRGAVIVHASLRPDNISADEFERRIGMRLGRPAARSLVSPAVREPCHRQLQRLLYRAAVSYSET